MYTSEDLQSMLQAIEILHRNKTAKIRKPSKIQIGYAYLILREFNFSDKEIDEMIDY